MSARFAAFVHVCVIGWLSWLGVFNLIGVSLVVFAIGLAGQKGKGSAFADEQAENLIRLFINNLEGLAMREG